MLPTTQYLPDTPSHGLQFQYGDDWLDGEPTLPAADPAVRLQLCIEFSNRHDYKTALHHARDARLMLQEALVGAIEEQGECPQLLVAQLVVAYHNIGFNLSALGRHRKGLEWFIRGLEIANRQLGEAHPITERVRKAEQQTHAAIKELLEQQQIGAELREEEAAQSASTGDSVDGTEPDLDGTDYDEPTEWVQHKATGIMRPVRHLDECPRRFEKGPALKHRIAEFVGLQHKPQHSFECPCTKQQIGLYRKLRTPVRALVATEMARARKQLQKSVDRVNLSQTASSAVLSSTGLQFLTGTSGEAKRDRRTLPKKVQRILDAHAEPSPPSYKQQRPSTAGPSPPPSSNPSMSTSPTSGARQRPSTAQPTRTIIEPVAWSLETPAAAVQRPIARPRTAQPRVPTALRCAVAHMEIKQQQHRSRGRAKRAATASRSRSNTPVLASNWKRDSRPKSALPLFAIVRQQPGPRKTYSFSNGSQISTQRSTKQSPADKPSKDGTEIVDESKEQQNAAAAKSEDEAVDVSKPESPSLNIDEHLTKLMLLMHVHESTQRVMEDSELVDAPHCAPKVRPSTASISYGAGMTTLSTPVGITKQEIEDKWSDRISETGFLSLSRKCCVNVHHLKTLKSEWDQQTRAKGKGLSLKQFEKIFRSSSLSANFDGDDFKEAAEELFWAMDVDGDGRLSFMELALGFSELLMPGYKDPLAVRKRQVMKDYACGVSLVYRVLDDNQNQQVSLFNMYKFMGETLPNYRNRKRLGDALFQGVLAGRADKVISAEMFMEKMMDNNVIWQVFATLIPWKYVDHDSQEYKESRADFLEQLNSSRVAGQYAFERSNSLELGCLTEFL